MKEPRAQKKSPGKAPRRAAQKKQGRFERRRRRLLAIETLVAFGLPFVTIGGESALRIDVPRYKLLFFGLQIGFDELALVGAATAFLLFAFALVTFIWGRVWCGYACPQSMLSELTRFVQPKRGKGREPLRVALVALVSVAVAADILWYFVTPWEFFGRLVRLELGPVLTWSWIVMATILFLDLVWVRYRFCATVCPYARLQGLLFDGDTLVVAFDEDRREVCIECDLCVRVCPVDVDLRQGQNDSCIACALCADACTRVLSPRGEATLLRYSQGADPVPAAVLEAAGGTGSRQAAPPELGSAPGPAPLSKSAPERRRGRPPIKRPAVVWTAAASLVFLVLTVGMAAGRTAWEMTVLPDAERPARLGAGRLIAGQVLALENRLQESLTLELQVDAGGPPAVVRPSSVTLEPGGYRRVPITILVETDDPGPHRTVLTAVPAAADYPAATAAFSLAAWSKP